MALLSVLVALNLDALLRAVDRAEVTRHAVVLAGDHALGEIESVETAPHNATLAADALVVIHHRNELACYVGFL